MPATGKWKTRLYLWNAVPIVVSEEDLVIPYGQVFPLLVDASSDASTTSVNMTATFGTMTVTANVGERFYPQPIVSGTWVNIIGACSISVGAFSLTLDDDLRWGETWVDASKWEIGTIGTASYAVSGGRLRMTANNPYSTVTARPKGNLYLPWRGPGGLAANTDYGQLIIVQEVAQDYPPGSVVIQYALLDIIGGAWSGWKTLTPPYTGAFYRYDIGPYSVHWSETNRIRVAGRDLNAKPQVYCSDVDGQEGITVDTWIKESSIA